MIKYYVFILAFYSFFISCGTARKSEPIKEPVPLTTQLLTKGESAFKEHCDKCHPNGESGLGPALNNKQLVPSFLIRFQVRNGLGKMPSFSEEEISSEELDAILAYMGELEDK